MLLFAAENLTDIDFSSTEAEIALKNLFSIDGLTSGGHCKAIVKDIARGLTTFHSRNHTRITAWLPIRDAPRPMPARLGE
jgi:hypothetical protein